MSDKISIITCLNPRKGATLFVFLLFFSASIVSTYFITKGTIDIPICEECENCDVCDICTSDIYNITITDYMSDMFATNFAYSGEVVLYTEFIFFIIQTCNSTYDDVQITYLYIDSNDDILRLFLPIGYLWRIIRVELSFTASEEGVPENILHQNFDLPSEDIISNNNYSSDAIGKYYFSGSMGDFDSCTILPGNFGYYILDQNIII